jgi:hypothetical protein
VKTIVGIFSAYLGNRDTELVLFKPIKVHMLPSLPCNLPFIPSIQENILASFQQLEQLVAANFSSADDLAIIGCPTQAQLAISLSFETLHSTTTTW